MSELPGFVLPDNPSQAAEGNPGLSIDRARLAPLIADLKRDLEQLQAGSSSTAELDRLRAEVAALWAMLEGGELSAAGLPQRLTNLHGLLNQPPVAQAEVEAFKAASYFTAIGRLLGLS